MEIEPDYDSEMRLPQGKSCSDCRSFRRCEAMFGHTATDTSCDWYPSRFAAREPSAPRRLPYADRIDLSAAPSLMETTAASWGQA